MKIILLILFIIFLPICAIGQEDLSLKCIDLDGITNYSLANTICSSQIISFNELREILYKQSTVTSLFLYDLSGKIIFHNLNFTGGDFLQSLTLPKGYYIVKVFNKYSAKVFKLYINH